MDPHPSIAHWDTVEAEVVNTGELHARWRDLGNAAGSFRAGVQRIEIEPGARSTPVHCHADEEEIFYVLGGSGLSWQDGSTYAVGAGDALVHRVHEEAHTLIAGDDGLDVLAFGPRSEANITWLPHAGVFRLGPRWLPVAIEHPYAAEAAAGPLAVPAPSPDRPATIVHVPDLDVVRFEHGDRRAQLRDVGRAGGSETTGLRHSVLDPGSRGAPHHCHSAEEELFVVLAGSGEVRLGEHRFAVERGSVVARPPGTGVAHSFAAGDESLEYLAWGTRVPGDTCYYPDSQKVALRSLGVVFRVEPADYWDGED